MTDIDSSKLRLHMQPLDITSLENRMNYLSIPALTRSQQQKEIA